MSRSRLAVALSFFALSSLSGCFVVQNSFEQDGIIFASQVLDLSDPKNVKLLAVRNLFQTYGCADCHNASNPQRRQIMSMTNSQWLHDSSWGVVAGSPSTSKLYHKIKKSGCTPGANLCNMPNGVDNMAEDDLDTLEDWINSL